MGSDNFAYSRRDVIVASVAVAIVVTFLGLGFGLASGATIPSTGETPSSDPPANAYEAALQILSEAPIIDGHNDFPLTIRELFKNDLTDLEFDSDLSATQRFAGYASDHTDLPRLRKGHVGGQFWSAYMGCSTQNKDATQLFMEQIDVIKRLVSKYSDEMSLVTTAQGIEDAFSSKKIASLIGVESGHAISSSLGVLRLFYETGVRYMTLTHSCNTPWADSSESEADGDLEPRNGGLSEFGKTVVKEMNRLGMLVDLSHVSNDTMKDALQTSRAPVIFSHSSARAVYNHSRNVPDDVLKLVKMNRGVVMVNFYDCFLVPNCGENNATVQDVIAHINHIREVAGVDHVGIGADYNGVTKTPVGLEDVSKYPNLFAALLEDSNIQWTPEELKKLASGNLIRVFKEAEQVREALKGELPHTTFIPVSDLGQDTACMSDAGLYR